MSSKKDLASSRLVSKKEKIFNWIIFVLLLLGAVVMVFPLIYMIATSFMTKNQILSGTLTILPDPILIGKYSEVLKKGQFINGIFNSLKIYLLPRRIRICKNEISWQKCIVSGIAGNHYDSVCGCHDSTVCHVYQTGLDQYSASTYYSGMLWKCQYYLFPSTEPDRNSGRSDGSSKIGWMWIFPYVSSDFYAIDEGGSGNAADVVVYGNLE